MKHVFAYIIVFCALLLSPISLLAHDTVIRMTANGFEPKEVTVTQGQSVSFVNETKDFRWPASNLHPTHGIYPEFDTKQGIRPGESWSFTFDKAGTWRMHDHLLRQYNETVTVKGENENNDGSEKNAKDKQCIEDATGNTQCVENDSTGFWSKIGQWFKDVWYRLTHWGRERPKNDNDNNDDNIDISKYNQDIEQGSEEMFKDDTALGSHLKKYGAKETITSLRLLEPKF